MSKTYRVQVLTNTEVPELGHNYSDAQYLVVPMTMTLAEVDAAYGADVDAEEAKRIDARIDEKNNPPVVKEPTLKELEDNKLMLLEQIKEIDLKLLEGMDKK